MKSQMYNQFSAHNPMSGVHGNLLEATVVGCNKLKDTEWISRQDPYVCLEYGSTKYRTRTCTDGGKHPVFQEKFTFSMIEGLRELNVVVWNSNSITFDDFIGSGKIQLQKVLSEGFDDSSWPIQTKTGRHAGEVRVILHYANAKQKQSTSYAPSAPPFVTPSAAPQVPLYSTPPPAVLSSYPPPPSAYTAAYTTPSPYVPPHSGAYPPQAYPPAHPSTYPPSYHMYPPPSTYPPQPYPPPPHVPSQYPPGPYSGMYPPPY